MSAVRATPPRPGPPVTAGSARPPAVPVGAAGGWRAAEGAGAPGEWGLAPPRCCSGVSRWGLSSAVGQAVVGEQIHLVPWGELEARVVVRCALEPFLVERDVQFLAAQLCGGEGDEGDVEAEEAGPDRDPFRLVCVVVVVDR